ncbi:MAG TPA: tetratricopeptide repeat protein [Terriglobales bacterium]|nr:tetratricopeptide repeat protein [Terriglobales bacterium]
MKSIFSNVLFLLCLFRAGNPACAQATSVSSSISGSPEESQLERGKQLIESGRFDDALAALLPLQKENPEPKGLEHQIGLAYYRKGDFARAQDAFSKAMDQNAEDTEAVQLRGLSLFQMGRPAEAIPYLKQVQAWIGPANVDASYVLGLCYMHTQNYDEARKAFAQMYGLAPDSAAAHLFLARMLLRQGYDPIAEQNAQKAAQMDPKLPLVHYLLGEFYLYKSNVQKAIVEFELEQKLNPGYAGTYDRLGDSYSRVGKYDDAERALQRAILLDATATGPYILMGKVLIKKKDYASAMNYLQKALRMDPSNYMTHHLMGEAYRGVGRTDDAERELKRAEELQTAQEAKPQA